MMMAPLVCFVSTVFCIVFCTLPNTVSGQCTTGFPDENTIESPPSSVPIYDRQFVFYSINFTCEMNITSWIFAAEINTQPVPPMTERINPELQIWRASTVVSNQLDLQSTVGVSEDPELISGSLYRYTPNDTVTVMPGDVLGISIAPMFGDPVTTFAPLFIDAGTGNTAEYFDDEFRSTGLVFIPTLENAGIEDRIGNQYVPLVTVEFGSPSPTSSLVLLPIPTSIITFTPSSSPSSSPSFSSVLLACCTYIHTFTSPSFSPSSSIPPVSTSSMITQMTTESSETVTTSIDTTTSTQSVSLSSSPPSSSSSFSSSSSLTSPTVPVGTASDILPTATIAGVVIAGILVAIIIGLVLILMILFVMGKKRRTKRTKSPPVYTNGYTENNQMDNPTYTGVVTNDEIPMSTTSTMTGDHFIRHYDVPGYADPLSPMPMDETGPHDETFSSSNIYNDVSFDENGHYEMEPQSHSQTALINNGHYEMTPGFLTPDTSHYEMEPGYTSSNANNLSNGHYEMQGGIYDIDLSEAHYEQPVISRSNSLANSNEIPQYSIIPKSSHEYSVLDNDIFVPTEEERHVIIRSRTDTGSSIFDERTYAQLGVMQKQKYENVVLFENSDVYWRPAAQTSKLYAQLSKKKYREIPRSQIHFTKHLGSGQFGTVNECIWNTPYESKVVAVKIVGPKALETEKVKLLQEGAIMGQFQHSNVVRLHGVVTVGEPVMVVIELMPNGDLRNHLLSIRSKLAQNVSADLPNQLLQFCKQVAKGMNYLSKKSFVHRDLAARNIFLDKDYVCKIGDFGMSRDLEDENYYVSHGGKIPVKWTAPEAIQYKKYSTLSDVWSFGALMYEIWSLGHKPFEGFSNPQTIDLVQSGYRLPPPPGCPRSIYQLMIHCWHPDSSRRPKFSEILDVFSETPTKLLSWRDMDKAVHVEASCLGAQLEAGQDLYPELQQTFIRTTIKVYK